MTVFPARVAARTATPRPRVQVVDVVADEASVTPEGRALALAAHGFPRAFRQPDIVGGLGGVEERAALAGAGGPVDRVVFVHHRRAPERGGWGLGFWPRWGEHTRASARAGRTQTRPRK